MLNHDESYDLSMYTKNGNLIVNSDKGWLVKCPKWGIDIDCLSKSSCEECEESQFIREEEMVLC